MAERFRCIHLKRKGSRRVVEDNAEDSSGKWVARKVTRKVAMYSILHTNDIRMVGLMGDDVADTHGIQRVISAAELLC